MYLVLQKVEHQAHVDDFVSYSQWKENWFSGTVCHVLFHATPWVFCCTTL